MQLVKAHTPGVFAESDGAVVYKGEDAGLHTRVFVTSKGLPTYETKDLGVITNEVKDFAYDKRILITGNDQSEYMKVVFAALRAIDAELAAKQNHLTNGTVRFGSGEKMSSRLGNVTSATEVIKTVGAAVEAETEELRSQVTLGAIKYSFLKHRLGGDIAFDVNESVSLEGNSGPYLQYAHARARSILAKAPNFEAGGLHDMTAPERSLARKLTEYSEVVEQAVTEFMPHHICTYLYELAQVFNRFYEQSRVIGDEREAMRLTLVRTYALTLEQGLGLLGIAAPEKI
jgi:arginyl-tRNA synthetase